MLNIIDTLKQQNNCSVFLDAVNITGLTDMLINRGPFTLIAPTDAGFRKLDSATFEYLNQHIKAWADIVKNHILYGTYLKQELSTIITAKTIDGQQLTIRVTATSPAKSIFVNDIPLVETDIHALNNSVIHTINDVIMFT